MFVRQDNRTCSITSRPDIGRPWAGRIVFILEMLDLQAADATRGPLPSGLGQQFASGDQACHSDTRAQLLTRKWQEILTHHPPRKEDSLQHVTQRYLDKRSHDCKGRILGVTPATERQPFPPLSANCQGRLHISEYQSSRDLRNFCARACVAALSWPGEHPSPSVHFFHCDCDAHDLVPLGLDQQPTFTIILKAQGDPVGVTSTNSSKVFQSKGTPQLLETPPARIAPDSCAPCIRQHRGHECDSLGCRMEVPYIRFDNHSQSRHCFGPFVSGNYGHDVRFALNMFAELHCNQ